MDILKEIARKTDGSGSQSTRAYNALRQAILTSDLAPGHPLLEIEISEHLGVSRTPVREAIRKLAADGLVEVIPYKGAFVKALSRQEVGQIYETAEGLEGMVAKLAAQRATPDQAEALLEQIRRMRSAFEAGDTEMLIEADDRFHLMMHEMAANPHLARTLERLHERVHRVRFLTARAFANRSISIDEHEQTAQAIAAGDAEAARATTQQHWERVREETLSLLP